MNNQPHFSSSPGAMKASTFIFALIALNTVIHALTFPPYTISNHPISSISSAIKPVIVERYYRYSHNGNASTDGLYFSPSTATYNNFQDRRALFQNLDVLHVVGTRGKRYISEKQKFIKVHLHRPAKVLLLVIARGFSKRDLISPTVDGLDGAYKFGIARGVITETKKPIIVTKKFKRPRRLPSHAVLIEGRVENVLELPHPKFITINEKPVIRFYILFAKDQDNAIEAVETPAMPSMVFNVLTNKIVETKKYPALPNTVCPNWLHDLHVTKTRESAEVSTSLNDKMYWRTWHPQVDPFYWCYYTHEHGAYPGNHMPMFGYTAWKTYQSDGSFEQRQDESHNGFKVFSFPLHMQEKFVVMVVHMHVAKARRFTARNHTTSVAIIDKFWKLELEFHMKMDFGAAKATLATNKDIGIGLKEEELIQELMDRKVIAGRRFNILNIDEHFPESVSKKFRFNCNITPNGRNARRLKNGIYEKWEGPLNTCSKSTRRFNRGFRFDIRDPSTGIRFFDREATDDNKQMMNGFAVNRVLVIPKESGDLEISKKHCHFNVFKSEAGIDLEKKNDPTGEKGVFYTDSYFRYIKSGPGKVSMRQFVSPNFVGITIKKGTLTPVDPWNSHMDYQDGVRTDSKRRFYNIENGIEREAN